MEYHPASSSDSASHKRPRSPGAEQPMPAAKVPRTSGQLQINYLVRQHKEVIPLVTIKETLPELLRLIGEYDGVLQRHESMAGNLGACPLGPILLKRFERLFDGPPKILKSHARDASVSWLDVVDFAQNKPEQFNLEKMRNGVRVCQFYTKQCRVEITEEDFVLIASGMPQKLIPPQPILEDEEKELGVMDLLDRNLGQIVQLADQASARARQLIHKMKSRRSAIIARRESEGISQHTRTRGTASPKSPTEPNGTNAPPARSVEHSQSPPIGGFTAVNVKKTASTDADKQTEDHPRSIATTPDQMIPDADGGNVTYINGRSIKGASPTERAEMMKNFMTPAEKDAAATPDDARRASFGTPRAQATSSSTVDARRRSDSIEMPSTSSLSKHTSVAIPNTPASLMPQAKTQVLERDDGGPFKTEMVARMESMPRGERVEPPCDRCRRLHMDCLKNLTACMGCTKKHAKCSWKDVKQDEMDKVNVRIAAHRQNNEANSSAAQSDQLGTVAEVSIAIEEQTRTRPGMTPVREEKDQLISTPAGVQDAVMEEAYSPRPEPVSAPKPPSPQRPPSAGKFDVRPPPLGQTAHDPGNRRSPPRHGQYPLWGHKDVVRGYGLDENDEGDRLQALAAQVYRSASQIVKPQD